MFKRSTPFWIFSLAALGYGQTQPILPQTPDVVVPGSFAPLTPPASTTVTGSKPLSVDEAVRVALHNQPNVAVAKANWDSAKGATKQASAAQSPTLGLAGSETNTGLVSGSDTNVSGGLGYNDNATLTLSMLLFDFGKTREAVRQQESLESAANHAFSQSQLDTAFAVRTAFYEFAQDQRLVAASEANVANRQAQLALAQARVLAGQGEPSDYVTAKTSLASAVISLTSSRVTATEAGFNLAIQLGIDPRTPLEVTESDEPGQLDDAGVLVKKALSQRQEVLGARAKLDAAEHGLSSARSGDLPSFTAAANLAARGQTNPFATDTRGIGITLTWPVWDGGLTDGRVQSANGSAVAATEQLRQASLFVINDVLQAVTALNGADLRHTTAQVEFANATELVRIQTGKYRGGIGQFLDLTTAQDNLYTAQKDLVQSENDVKKARALLRHAVGEGLPSAPKVN